VNVTGDRHAPRHRQALCRPVEATKTKARRGNNQGCDDALQAEEASISFEIEDIRPQDWREDVYKPDIIGKSETIYKNPGVRSALIAAVIASEAKAIQRGVAADLDCFLAIGPRNDAPPKAITSESE